MRFHKNWKTGIARTVALGAGSVISGSPGKDGRAVALNAALVGGTALVAVSRRRSRADSSLTPQCEYRG